MTGTRYLNTVEVAASGGISRITENFFAAALSGPERTGTDWIMLKMLFSRIFSY